MANIRSAVVNSFHPYPDCDAPTSRRLLKASAVIFWCRLCKRHITRNECPSLIPLDQHPWIQAKIPNMFGKMIDDFERLQALQVAQKAAQPSWQKVAPMILYIAVVVSAGTGLGLFIAFFQKTRTETTGSLWWEESVTVDIPLHTRMAFLMWGIGLLAVSAALTTIAIRRITNARRLKKYPPILKGTESIGIQRIVDITGSSRATVARDIQTLIDSEVIEDLYIDYSADQVVSKKYIPNESHKTVVKCSECGGNNEVIVGITRECNFCGQPLLRGTD